ncbi:AraC family transcriptional regulator [Paenibacillus sacheonensis]|uniref:Helix-turn-helix domain-containing protein n=1 Tax=Paenibacillus sacheonensis TaxID=742054 RepID=A0A7X4YQQ9_9BACL|nr:AraC family transcriptional regulator [Paenibacillus sacheonensis]MBM7567899.1 AraC-like DNA-binding protein [Paenibacillus sacheonensis]NBC70783.1 helix-turn-helix domain-containing protein [Paenibacillus sacheonensis]
MSHPQFTSALSGADQDGHSFDGGHKSVDQLAELGRLIERHTGRDGMFGTSVPSLHLIRSSKTTLPVNTVYEPAIVIVARGTKIVMLGEDSFTYGPSSHFVVSVDLPVTSRLIQASPEAPYLCMRLGLDPAQVLEMTQGADAEDGREAKRGAFVDWTSPELLDAAVRLVRLLDTPGDIPHLAPLVVREIYYRIMKGSQGGAFKQLALAGSGTSRIASVIARIKLDYAQPLHIDELARMVHMGPSSLHRHFKEVTALSPLQYLKRIRLQEARRLLLAESLDAADAAYRVGYESATQFSREYARLFGLPPISDIKRLREETVQEID